MNKKVLYAGGGAVAVLVAGLVFMLGRETEPKQRVRDHSTPQARRDAAPRRIERPGPPDLAAQDAGAAALAPIAPDGTQRGDVRDHTGEPPSGTPTKLRPQATAQLRGFANPNVKYCARELRTADPPVKAKVSVYYTAVVEGKKVRIEDVSTKSEGITPEIDACIREAFEKTTFDAPPDQEDGIRQAQVQSFDLP